MSSLFFILLLTASSKYVLLTDANVYRKRAACKCSDTLYLFIAIIWLLIDYFSHCLSQILKLLKATLFSVAYHQAPRTQSKICSRAHTYHVQFIILIPFYVAEDPGVIATSTLTIDMSRIVI